MLKVELKSEEELLDSWKAVMEKSGVKINVDKGICDADLDISLKSFEVQNIPPSFSINTFDTKDREYKRYKKIIKNESADSWDTTLLTKILCNSNHKFMKDKEWEKFIQSIRDSRNDLAHHGASYTTKRLDELVSMIEKLCDIYLDDVVKKDNVENKLAELEQQAKEMTPNDIALRLKEVEAIIMKENQFIINEISDMNKKMDFRQKVLLQAIHNNDVANAFLSCRGIFDVKFNETIERSLTHYTGRVWLTEQLEESLKKESKGILIVGAAGVGKTSFASQVFRDFSESNRLLFYYFCDAQNFAESLLKRNFIYQLVYSLLQRSDMIPSFVNAVLKSLKIKDDGQEDPKALILKLLNNSVYLEDTLIEFYVTEPLKHITLEGDVEKPFLMVIDGLDEALVNISPANKETSIVHTIKKLFDSLPKWIKIVSTSRPSSNKEFKEMGVSFDVKIDSQDSNNTKDIENFIRKKIKIKVNLDAEEDDKLNKLLKIAELLQTIYPDVGDKIIESLSFESFVQVIKKNADGIFLYAKLVMDELYQEKVCNWSKFIKDGKVKFPKKLKGMYKKRFKKIALHSDWENLKRVLEVLLVSNEALNSKQIVILLGKDRYKFEAIHREIVSFIECFLLKDSFGNYKIFHKSLSDWLTDRKENDRFYCSTSNGHLIIASTISKLVKNDDQIEWTALDFVYIRDYALKYGISHMLFKCQHGEGGFQCGVEECEKESIKLVIEAERILLNFNWLMSKLSLKDHDAHNLLLDINLFVNQCDNNPIKLRCMKCFQSAIRLSLQALREDFRHLPSQLIGRLIDLDKDYKEDYGDFFVPLVNAAESYDDVLWLCHTRRTLKSAGPLLHVLEGHEGSVRSASFSNDADADVYKKSYIHKKKIFFTR